MADDPELSEEYILELLKKDAKKLSTSYDRSGIYDVLPKRPTGAAPKANTRFLKNIVREADSHNAALKQKELSDAGRRLRAMAREKSEQARRDHHDTRRSRRYSSRESSEERIKKPYRSSSRRDRSTEGQDHRRKRTKYRSRSPEGRGRKRSHRSYSRSRSPRHRKHTRRSASRTSSSEHRRYRVRRDSESPSPRHRKRTKRRSSRSSSPEDRRHDEHKYSRSDDRKHQNHHRYRDRSESDLDRTEQMDLSNHRGHRKGKRIAETRSSHSNVEHEQADKSDDDDPLSSFLGPKPPPKQAPPQIRGRGTTAFTSGIDQRFSSTYDPTSDIQPDSNAFGEEDDWDQALEALRDRQKFRQAGADRLLAAGFTKEEVERMERGGERNESDVRWTKKGEAREWDRGKTLNDDGHISLDGDKFGRLL